MNPFAIVFAFLVSLLVAVSAASFPNIAHGSEPAILEPDDGIFSTYGPIDPYYIRVNELLLADHQYRKCQMLFMPAFQNEGIVYIVRDQDSTKISVVTKEIQPKLWSAMMDVLWRESDGKSISLKADSQYHALNKVTVHVTTKTAQIDPATADLLEAIWEAILKNIEYPDLATYGKDGVTYHAAHYFSGLGYRAGKTWSPKKGTQASDFIQIAEALRDFANADEKVQPAKHEQLLALAKGFRGRLGSHK